MKKIIASAVGLVLVGGVAATTASAVENQFGGYWRTRAYIQDNFDGTDSSSVDIIDNRTRLYYTAKFNDDFKFVNKFEFNTQWGKTGLAGGGIGADGRGIFRIKNSYADWNMGPANVKLGIQAAVVSRGFIFDDDFSGIIVTGNFGNVSVPVAYMAVKDEDAGEPENQDMFAAMPTIKISDAVSVTPFGVYYTTAGFTSSETADDGTVTTSTVADMDVYYLGVDVDLNMDPVSVWGTAIYNGGENGDNDIQAFLVAAGVNAGVAHGQAFYASGDDDATDGDDNAFVSAPGQSYYWSEIMGLGIFDNTASNGAPGNAISNVMAFNGGVTIKPMDKLKLDADVWYAMLAEDNAAGDDELGWEFDGKVTYSIFDNLSAEFVLAYLVSGDATGDEDVLEGGVRVSLKF